MERRGSSCSRHPARHVLIDLTGNNHPAAICGPMLMSPRLTRGEYWLLSQAVFRRAYLPLLALPEGPPWHVSTIQQALNTEGHGMDIAELAQSLRRMAQHNWISMGRLIDNDWVPVGCDLADINAALVHQHGSWRNAVFYGLTSRGGHVWELFARPRWDWYLDDHEEGPGDDSSAPANDGAKSRYVIATDRARLDRYMWSMHHEVDVVAGSEILSEVPVWQLAYWKAPQTGIRCSFRFRKPESKPGPPCSTEDHRRRWCDWL
jgi:hypothetical protein